MLIIIKLWLSGPVLKQLIVILSPSCYKKAIPAARVRLLPEADALEGLSEFCAQQAAQLLVRATTGGCLTRRFFHPHHPQPWAYRLRIPVLLLPTRNRPTETSCAACSRRKAAAHQGTSASPASLPKS